MLIGPECADVNTRQQQHAGVSRLPLCPGQIMRQYRVCLAPLRFGAGLKGKVVDAWTHGLPVCTTPIGAEGMCNTLPDKVLRLVLPPQSGKRVCGKHARLFHAFTGEVGRAVGQH